jgi:carbamate kinase
MAGQFHFARRAMEQLGPLLGSDVELVLGHGNGPQVGHMLIRVEQSLGQAYAVPLEVCVAESEGELGYVLQQSLHNVLVERGMPRPVVSVLTQVLVDRRDPAFSAPTKPIGPFYDASRAETLRGRGFVLHEDAEGRGHRRVVPSPEPVEVVEGDVVGQLLDLGVVVVAAGGGGVPVVERDGRFKGVDAVVDKDSSAALLAGHVGADLLVILTGVPCVYLDYSKATQRPIGHTTPAGLRGWAEQGHFPAGSMGPKVEAAVQFVDRPGRRAIICDPASLQDALHGEAGPVVTLEGPA